MYTLITAHISPLLSVVISCHRFNGPYKCLYSTVPFFIVFFSLYVGFKVLMLISREAVVFLEVTPCNVV